jgi:hypothetical protein
MSEMLLLRMRRYGVGTPSQDSGAVYLFRKLVGIPVRESSAGTSFRLGLGRSLAICFPPRQRAGRICNTLLNGYPFSDFTVFDLVLRCSFTEPAMLSVNSFVFAGRASSKFVKP